MTIDQYSSSLGEARSSSGESIHLPVAIVLNPDAGSSAGRAIAGNDNISLVGSFGASGGRIAVD